MAELAAELTDEQIEAFFATVEGTVAFAAWFRTARTEARPDRSPAARPLSHLVAPVTDGLTCFCPHGRRIGAPSVSSGAIKSLGWATTDAKPFDEVWPRACGAGDRAGHRADTSAKLARGKDGRHRPRPHTPSQGSPSHPTDRP